MPELHGQSQRSAWAANVRLYYAFRFLVNFQFWQAIWVVYLDEARGLSLTQITALDAPFWLAMVLLEVPTGAIADRWGRRISLNLGAAVLTVAIFTFAIADTYWLLLVSYLAWAVAYTLFSGADAAFIYDSLKQAGREREYQRVWGRCQAIGSAGVLLGMLTGPPFAAATNLWVPIAVSALITAAAWLVTLRFVEPPRHLDGHEPLGYFAGVRRAAGIVHADAPLRWFMLLAALVMSIAVSIGILMQPFLKSHDVDTAMLGVFQVPGNLIGIFAAVHAYRLSAAFGTKGVMIFMPASVLLAAGLLGAVDSLWAIVFYPLCSAVVALSFPIVSDYLNRRIPSAQRATILSMYQLLFSLLIAGVEPALGAIGDAAGLPAAYRSAAIALALCAPPLLLLWLRAGRREPLPASAAAGGP
ncbi:MAG: MFS transporter [Gammaproteobacteria bacterium]